MCVLDSEPKKLLLHPRTSSWISFGGERYTHWLLPWLIFSMKNYNENSESVSVIYLHGLGCPPLLSCPAWGHSDPDRWHFSSDADGWHFSPVMAVLGPGSCSSTQLYLLLPMLFEWRNTCDEFSLQFTAAKSGPQLWDANCGAVTPLAHGQTAESEIAMSGPVTLQC